MTGNATLARRLDRFLIKQPLLQMLDIARQWVGHGGISDHSPVFLEFAFGPLRARPPYKFNSRWLLDPDYHNLVVHEWQHCDLLPDIEPARVINDNRNRIKGLTIKWVGAKRRMEWEELKRIELEISQLNESDQLGFRSIITKEHLISLEATRTKLLRQKEADWRLKSRAIWL